MAAFVVGVGALVAGLIPSEGFWLFVGCIGLLAIACAWFNAPLMTLLQKGIPDEKLGRVMGLYTALSGLAIPAGTALGGIVAEITGTPMFFCIDGAFIIALAVALGFSKSVRVLDSESRRQSSISAAHQSEPQDGSQLAPNSSEPRTRGLQ